MVLSIEGKLAIVALVALALGLLLWLLFRDPPEAIDREDTGGNGLNGPSN